MFTKSQFLYYKILQKQSQMPFLETHHTEQLRRLLRTVPTRNLKNLICLENLIFQNMAE